MSYVFPTLVGISTGSPRLLPDPKPNDIIIPVMGRSGTGKSTFINWAAEKEVTENDSLEPSTTEVIPVPIVHPSSHGRRVVFFDTPGFDSLYMEDTLSMDASKVVELVKGCLKRLYGNTNQIAGILYLHDITDKRPFVADLNIPVRIIAVTTSWSLVKQYVGEKRETQLADLFRDRLCKNVIQHRFRDSHDSAWKIVDALMKEPSHQPPEPKSARLLPTSLALDQLKVIQNPRPDDIIILVMGPSGVGKSTFINKAVGKDIMTVGNELISCTSKVVAVAVPHPSRDGRRVVFVDTPCFDNTFESDYTILDLVARWLEMSYKKMSKIAGIIYLHDISHKRMHGSSFKNFTMFRALCGSDAAVNVILVTTLWSEVEESIGQSREQQLANLYWKPLLEEGARFNRFLNSFDSAWDIIASLLDKVPLEAIQIQKELVEIGKLLPETEAGKALRNELNGFLRDQKAKAQEMLKERTPESKARHDKTASRQLMTFLFGFKARPTHKVKVRGLK